MAFSSWFDYQVVAVLYIVIKNKNKMPPAAPTLARTPDDKLIYFLSGLIQGVCQGQHEVFKFIARYHNMGCIGFVDQFADVLSLSCFFYFSSIVSASCFYHFLATPGRKSSVLLLAYLSGCKGYTVVIISGFTRCLLLCISS